MMMANDRWTHEDERKLAELLIRKTRVENTRRERLSRALSNCPGMNSSVVPQLADSLISNAAEVCSALELYVLVDAETIGD
jgi:hypothetical protein